MCTKIIIGMLLTLGILAFPISNWGFSATEMLWLKIGKASLFCGIMFIMVRKLGTESNFPLQTSIKGSSIQLLLPAIISLCVYVILYRQKIFGHGVNDFSSIALIILSTFFAATGEEFVFRGYIYYVLRKYNKSVVKSMLTSSVLFALTHSINFNRYGDIWSVINQVVFAMGMGLVLSAIFIISKNIWLAGTLHTIVNLPLAFSKFKEVENTIIENEIPTSFWENVLASLLYIMIISPIFLLAGYYLRKIYTIENKKNDVAVNLSPQE